MKRVYPIIETVGQFQKLDGETLLLRSDGYHIDALYYYDADEKIIPELKDDLPFAVILDPAAKQNIIDQLKGEE